MRLFALVSFVMITIQCSGMNQSSELQSPFSIVPKEIIEHIIINFFLPNRDLARNNPIQSLKEYKKILRCTQVNKRWKMILEKTWIVKDQVAYLNQLVNYVLFKNSSLDDSDFPTIGDYVKIVAQYDLFPFAKCDIEARNLMEIDNLYLNQAAKYNAITILNFLLDIRKRKTVINLTIKGRTLLHDAVLNNSYDVAKVLLEKGDADPNISCFHDKLTPLHIASKNNSIKSVELLIHHKANINAKDSMNVTPLHYAVLNTSYELAQLLLENGADTSNKAQIFIDDIFSPVCFNGTPLKLAKFYNNEKMTKLLKSHKKKCTIQ